MTQVVVWLYASILPAAKHAIVELSKWLTPPITKALAYERSVMPKGEVPVHIYTAS